ncbi:hypothetical protein [Cohnella yongneupensis]|uniref:Uncharacterized protein n=1 Tax=Cohnella yongneupensis TaxID=425006 RepID=A0ABW0QWA1_9BACL
MKKDKWLKWKIGAVASVGVALLFHEVRSSVAFEQATASSLNDSVPVAVQQQPQQLPAPDQLDRTDRSQTNNGTFENRHNRSEFRPQTRTRRS